MSAPWDYDDSHDHFDADDIDLAPLGCDGKFC